MRSPTQLPEGIQRALDEAVMRTGLTRPLRIAIARLPVLVRASPEDVEHAFRWLLHRDSFKADPDSL